MYLFYTPVLTVQLDAVSVCGTKKRQKKGGGKMECVSVWKKPYEGRDGFWREFVFGGLLEGIGWLTMENKTFFYIYIIFSCNLMMMMMQKRRDEGRSDDGEQGTEKRSLLKPAFLFSFLLDIFVELSEVNYLKEKKIFCLL